jgi:hypothetical protein
MIVTIIHHMVFIVPLSGCRHPLPSPHVDVGRSKADAIDQLGDPEEMRIIYKRTEYIWSPEETWWDTLEMGCKIDTESTNIQKGPINYTS